MKFSILFPLILAVSTAQGGTGHAKDMDLTYLLILMILGIVLLIWNGVDYLKKNGQQIRKEANRVILRIRSRIQKFLNPLSGLRRRTIL